VRQESGQSMMVGKNEVSEKLIRPTKEGEPYRAIITVASESRYSIQRNREETPPEEEQEGQSAESDLIDEPVEEDGQEILDSELIGGSSSKNQTRRTPPGATEQFVARQRDEGRRDYELVYENGQWRLITELDPETERATRDAFERALKTQIVD
jgi:hypothetical protein